MSSAASKRFSITSVDEIDDKRVKLNSDNTRKANLKASNALKDYLKEVRKCTDFENFDTAQLAGVLSHFYMDVRQQNGERYKTSSLENMRHSLNRYLKSSPFYKDFDIITTPEFANANYNFKASIAELKRLGYGHITHHPVVNEADRAKLYSSIHMSPKTPCGLFNKVQFDVRLYFFRRGAENMVTMTKDTFRLEIDSKTGLKYITNNKDEMTKNHRENDKEMSSAIMPETPGSQFCPVVSFQLYLSKLHPEQDRLWQRPRDSFNDEDQTWFCNVPVGQKKLSKSMSDLSRLTKLSTIYTNHSIRTTGATILSKNSFGPAQIMSVTGHKSVQSLTLYQRVDRDEKIQMGQTLSANMVQPDQSAQTTTSTTNQVVPAVENNVSDIDHLAGLNFEDIFNNYTENIPIQHNRPDSSFLPPTQIFKDCQVTIIHSLTVNK